MSYEKPWLSYQAQLELLIKRGMDITDNSRALNYLERIGYYRLSGYWNAFRIRNSDKTFSDDFRVGTTFQDALKLYIFDKRLRLIALDALERIEIALRVDLAHTLGKSSQFAYMIPECFDKSFSVKIDPETGTTRHHAWITRHAAMVSRSKEDCIRFNREKYGYPIAIWVVSEIWDFGTMSTLYGGMLQKDQDEIARKYGLRNGRTFASWLKSLNEIRNVSAHHARLWNRNVVNSPGFPAKNELEWFENFRNPENRPRPFLGFCILKHFMDFINPNSRWGERFKELVNKQFPDLTHIGINQRSIGAYDGWESWELWEQKRKPLSDVPTEADRSKGVIVE